MTPNPHLRRTGRLLSPTVIGCLLALPTAGTAQRLTPEWQPLPVATLPSFLLPPAVRTRIEVRPSRPDTYPRTYWKEGGVIGGLVLGIAAALLVDGLCGSDGGEENCTAKTFGGAALGAGVGFTAGALIGGLFPKGRHSDPDS